MVRVGVPRRMKSSLLCTGIVLIAFGASTDSLLFGFLLFAIGGALIGLYEHMTE